MCAAFGFGVWFISPWKSPRNPPSKTYGDPRTKKERAAGARFIPSTIYRHYRNPMRTLRRFLGWPSGRQWRKLYKQYNREAPPNGAWQMAQIAQRLTTARALRPTPSTTSNQE